MFERLKNLKHEWKTLLWDSLTAFVPRFSPEDLTPRYGNPPREVKRKLRSIVNALALSHMNIFGLIALQFRSYRTMVIEKLRPIGLQLRSIQERFPSRNQPGIELSGRTITC